MPKAVQNYYLPTGSDALISGVPDIVEFYEDYIENFEKYLKKAMERVTPVYEQHLQDNAAKKGWRDAQRHISVSYDAKSSELSITGDDAQEYGTGVEPPKPVIRSAIAGIQDLEDAIANEIERYVY